MSVLASLAVTLPGDHPRLVLLHGFTQTAGCWGPVGDDLARDHELVRLDAPGHGSASDVRANLHEGARRTAEAAGRGVYVGYSMGARLALHVALDHPEVVQGLVLVGGTPGIEDDGARATRRARDHDLADHLRAVGVGAFLAEWLDQPLFAGLPGWARFEKERGRNTAEGLASSLELAGTGSQQPLWDRLAELHMPVLAMAGADDIRFAEIATRLAVVVGPHASVALVPGAGHAAHLERPDAFLALLRPWLAALPSFPRQ
jgi:2-succinyl-6-hydroxy-2,4-cyclohexadiene-1-carboxylate synthase